jgi:hypothetical protein
MLICSPDRLGKLVPNDFYRVFVQFCQNTRCRLHCPHTTWWSSIIAWASRTWTSKSLLCKFSWLIMPYLCMSRIWLFAVRLEAKRRFSEGRRRPSELVPQVNNLRHINENYFASIGNSTSVRCFQEKKLPLILCSQPCTPGRLSRLLYATGSSLHAPDPVPVTRGFIVSNSLRFAFQRYFISKFYALKLVS